MIIATNPANWNSQNASTENFLKMNKIIFTVLLAPICFILHAQENEIKNLVILTSDSPLKITDVTVNAEKIGLFEKFEITFKLAGKWENPFDPDQIRVEAVFNMPDGSRVTVPGFFYQEYYHNAKNNIEKVDDPVWKVRFAPVLPGTYSYQIFAINKSEEIKTAPGKFDCLSFDTSHGFIKVSKSNPLYFDFTDDTPFFGIGMGRILADEGGCYKRFSDAGGNFNRLFLTNGKFDIQELIRDIRRPDRGLGKINLESSWNLDPAPGTR